MSSQAINQLIDIGFSSDDIDIVLERSRGRFDTPGDIRTLLNSYPYDYSWEREYVVKSAASALRDNQLSCINAGILAYSLLNCFDVFRQLIMAIHRRDSNGVECGHIVTLYREGDGEMWSFSKSNHVILNDLKGPFKDEFHAAVTFGKAYKKIGFTPLYFGFYNLEEFVEHRDWQTTDERLNAVCDYMIGNYQYCFEESR